MVASLLVPEVSAQVDSLLVPGGLGAGGFPPGAGGLGAGGFPPGAEVSAQAVFLLVPEVSAQRASSRCRRPRGRASLLVPEASGPVASSWCRRSGRRRPEGNGWLTK